MSNGTENTEQNQNTENPKKEIDIFKVLATSGLQPKEIVESWSKDYEPIINKPENYKENKELYDRFKDDKEFNEIYEISLQLKDYLSVTKPNAITDIVPTGSEKLGEGLGYSFYGRQRASITEMPKYRDFIDSRTGEFHSSLTDDELSSLNPMIDMRDPLNPKYLLEDKNMPKTALTLNNDIYVVYDKETQEFNKVIVEPGTSLQLDDRYSIKGLTGTFVDNTKYDQSVSDILDEFNYSLITAIPQMYFTVNKLIGVGLEKLGIDSSFSRQADLDLAFINKLRPQKSEQYEDSEWNDNPIAFGAGVANVLASLIVQREMTAGVQTAAKLFTKGLGMSENALKWTASGIGGGLMMGPTFQSAKQNGLTDGESALMTLFAFPMVAITEKLIDADLFTKGLTSDAKEVVENLLNKSLKNYDGNLGTFENSTSFMKGFVKTLKGDTEWQKVMAKKHPFVYGITSGFSKESTQETTEEFGYWVEESIFNAIKSYSDPKAEYGKGLYNHKYGDFSNRMMSSWVLGGLGGMIGGAIWRNSNNNLEKDIRKFIIENKGANKEYLLTYLYNKYQEGNEELSKLNPDGSTIVKDEDKSFDIPFNIPGKKGRNANRVETLNDKLYYDLKTTIDALYDIYEESKGNTDLFNIVSSNVDFGSEYLKAMKLIKDKEKELLQINNLLGEEKDSDKHKKLLEQKNKLEEEINGLDYKYEGTDKVVHQDGLKDIIKKFTSIEEGTENPEYVNDRIKGNYIAYNLAKSVVDERWKKEGKTKTKDNKKDYYAEIAINFQILSMKDNYLLTKLLDKEKDIQIENISNYEKEKRNKYSNNIENALNEIIASIPDENTNENDVAKIKDKLLSITKMSDIKEIDLISDKIKEQLGIIKNKLNKINDELFVDPTDAENYEKKIDLQNNLEDIEKVQSTYLNALEAKQNEKSKETRLLEYFELLFSQLENDINVAITKEVPDKKELQDLLNKYKEQLESYSVYTDVKRALNKNSEILEKHTSSKEALSDELLNKIDGILDRNKENLALLENKLKSLGISTLEFNFKVKNIHQNAKILILQNLFKKYIANGSDKHPELVALLKQLKPTKQIPEEDIACPESQKKEILDNEIILNQIQDYLIEHSTILSDDVIKEYLKRTYFNENNSLKIGEGYLYAKDQDNNGINLLYNLFELGYNNISNQKLQNIAKGNVYVYVINYLCQLKGVSVNEINIIRSEVLDNNITPSTEEQKESENTIVSFLNTNSSPLEIALELEKENFDKKATTAEKTFYHKYNKDKSTKNINIHIKNTLNLRGKFGTGKSVQILANALIYNKLYKQKNNTDSKMKILLAGLSNEVLDNTGNSLSKYFDTFKDEKTLKTKEAFLDAIRNDPSSLTSNDIIIFDESSILSLDELMEIKEALKDYKGRLILVGDTSQMFDITQNDSIRYGERTGLRTIPLTKVFSNSDPIINILIKQWVETWTISYMGYGKEVMPNMYHDGQRGVKYVEGDTSNTAIEKVINEFINSKDGVLVFINEKQYAQYKDKVKLSDYPGRIFVLQQEKINNQIPSIQGLRKSNIFLALDFLELKNNPEKYELYPASIKALFYTAFGRLQSFGSLTLPGMNKYNLVDKPKWWIDDIDKEKLRSETEKEKSRIAVLEDENILLKKIIYEKTTTSGKSEYSVGQYVKYDNGKVGLITEISEDGTIILENKYEITIPKLFIDGIATKDDYDKYKESLKTKKENEPSLTDNTLSDLNINDLTHNYKSKDYRLFKNDTYLFEGKEVEIIAFSINTKHDIIIRLNNGKDVPINEFLDNIEYHDESPEIEVYTVANRIASNLKDINVVWGSSYTIITDIGNKTILTNKEKEFLKLKRELNRLISSKISDKLEVHYLNDVQLIDAEKRDSVLAIYYNGTKEDLLRAIYEDDPQNAKLYNYVDENFDTKQELLRYVSVLKDVETDYPSENGKKKIIENWDDDNIQGTIDNGFKLHPNLKELNKKLAELRKNGYDQAKHKDGPINLGPIEVAQTEIIDGNTIFDFNNYETERVEEFKTRMKEKYPTIKFGNIRTRKIKGIVNIIMQYSVIGNDISNSSPYVILNNQKINGDILLEKIQDDLSTIANLSKPEFTTQIFNSLSVIQIIKQNKSKFENTNIAEIIKLFKKYFKFENNQIKRKGTTSELTVTRNFLTELQKLMQIDASKQEVTILYDSISLDRMSKNKSGEISDSDIEKLTIGKNTDIHHPSYFYILQENKNGVRASTVAFNRRRMSLAQYGYAKQEALNIVKELLGEEWVDRVITRDKLTHDGIDLFGMVLNGKIYYELTKMGIDKPTVRHEIFHVIFKYYLTKEEQQALFKEVNNITGITDITDAEEWMARKFGRTDKNVKTGIIRRFFDWLENIVSKWFYHSTKLTELYEMINSGSFVNKTPHFELSNTVAYNIKGDLDIEGSDAILDDEVSNDKRSKHENQKLKYSHLSKYFGNDVERVKTSLSRTCLSFSYLGRSMDQDVGSIEEVINKVKNHYSSFRLLGVKIVKEYNKQLSELTYTEAKSAKDSNVLQDYFAYHVSFDDVIDPILNEIFEVKHDDVALYDKSKFNADRQISNNLKMFMEGVPYYTYTVGFSNGKITSIKNNGWDNSSYCSPKEIKYILYAITDSLNLELNNSSRNSYEDKFAKVLYNYAISLQPNTPRFNAAMSLLERMYGLSDIVNGYSSLSLKNLKKNTNIPERKVAIENFMTHIICNFMNLHEASGVKIDMEYNNALHKKVANIIRLSKNDDEMFKNFLKDNIENNIFDINGDLRNHIISKIDKNNKYRKFNVKQDGVYYNVKDKEIKILEYKKDDNNRIKAFFTDEYFKYNETYAKEILALFGLKKSISLITFNDLLKDNKEIQFELLKKVPNYKSQNEKEDAKNFMAESISAMFLTLQYYYNETKVKVDLDNDLKNNNISIVEYKNKLSELEYVEDLIDSYYSKLGEKAIVDPMSKIILNENTEILDEVKTIHKPTDLYRFLTFLANREISNRPDDKLMFIYRVDNTKEYKYQLRDDLNKFEEYGSSIIEEEISRIDMSDIDNSKYFDANGKPLYDYLDKSSSTRLYRVNKFTGISSNKSVVSPNTHDAIITFNELFYTSLVKSASDKVETLSVLLDNISDKTKIYEAVFTIDGTGNERLFNVVLDKNKISKVIINYKVLSKHLDKIFDRYERNRVVSINRWKFFIKKLSENGILTSDELILLANPELFEKDNIKMFETTLYSFIQNIKSNKEKYNNFIYEAKKYLHGNEDFVMTKKFGEEYFLLGYATSMNSEVKAEINDKEYGLREYDKIFNPWTYNKWKSLDNLESKIKYIEQLFKNEYNRHISAYYNNNVIVSEDVAKLTGQESPFFNKDKSVNDYFKAQYWAYFLNAQNFNPIFWGDRQEYSSQLDENKRKHTFVTPKNKLVPDTENGVSSKMKYIVVDDEGINKEKYINDPVTGKKVRIADGQMVGNPIANRFIIKSFGGFENAPTGKQMYKTMANYTDYATGERHIIKHADDVITNDTYNNNYLYRLYMEDILLTWEKECVIDAKNKSVNYNISLLDIFNSKMKELNDLDLVADYMFDYINNINNPRLKGIIKNNMIWGIQYKSGVKSYETGINQYDFTGVNRNMNLVTRTLNSKEIGLVLNPNQDVEETKNVQVMHQLLSFIGSNNKENSQIAERIFKAFSKIYEKEIEPIKKEMNKNFDEYVRNLSLNSINRSKYSGSLAEVLNNRELSIQIPQYRTAIVQLLRNYLTSRSLRQKMYGTRLNQASGYGFKLFENDNETLTLNDIENRLGRRFTNKELVDIVNSGVYQDYKVRDLESMQSSDNTMKPAEVFVSFSYFKIFELEKGETLTDALTIHYKDKSGKYGTLHIKDSKFTPEMEEFLKDKTLLDERSNIFLRKIYYKENNKKYVKANKEANQLVLDDFNKSISDPIYKDGTDPKRFISKREFDDFDILRAKIEYANAKGYIYKEEEDAFYIPENLVDKINISYNPIEYIKQYYKALDKALDMFLVRIPTSRLGYGAKARIKGFVQDNGNNIYIPLGLTVLNDSDFDIDQLSAYFKYISNNLTYNEVRDENGTLKDIDEINTYEELQDYILESIYDIYNNKENHKAILIDSNIDDLRSIVDMPLHEIKETDEYKALSKEEQNEFDKQKNNYKYLRSGTFATFVENYHASSTASDTISIFAKSLSTISYMLQITDINEFKKILPGFAFIENMLLENGKNGIPLRIGDYLQIALDNAKEMLLGEYGINETNASLVTILILHGWSNIKIKTYLNSPAIKQVFSKSQKGGNIDNKKKDYQIKDIVEDTLASLMSLDQSSIDKALTKKNQLIDELDTLYSVFNVTQKEISEYRKSKEKNKKEVKEKKYFAEEERQRYIEQANELGISLEDKIDDITEKAIEIDDNSLLDKIIAIQDEINKMNEIINSQESINSLNTLSQYLDEGAFIKRFGDIISLRNGIKVNDYEFERDIFNYELSIGSLLENYDAFNWSLEKHIEFFKEHSTEYLRADNLERRRASNSNGPRDTKLTNKIIKREIDIAKLGNIKALVQKFPHIENGLRLCAFEKQSNTEHWDINNKVFKQIEQVYLNSMELRTWDFQSRRIKFYNNIMEIFKDVYFKSLKNKNADLSFLEFNEILGEPVKNIVGLSNIDLSDSKGRKLYSKCFPEFMKEFLNDIQDMSYSEMIKKYKQIDLTSNDLHLLKNSSFIKKLEIIGQDTSERLILRNSAAINEQDMQLYQDEFAKFTPWLKTLFQHYEIIQHNLKFKNGSIMHVMGIDWLAEFSDAIKATRMNLKDKNFVTTISEKLLRAIQFSDQGSVIHGQNESILSEPGESLHEVKRIKIKNTGARYNYMREYFTFLEGYGYDKENAFWLLNKEIDTDINSQSNITDIELTRIFSGFELAKIKTMLPGQIISHTFHNGYTYMNDQEVITETGDILKVIWKTTSVCEFKKVGKNNESLQILEKIENLKKNSQFSLDELKTFEGIKLNRDAVRLLINHISNKIKDVTIVETNDEEVKRLYGDDVKARAFVLKGVVYINTDRVLSTDFIHELTHMWEKALKEVNQKKYSQLRNDAIELINNNNPIVLSIKEKYKQNRISLSLKSLISEVIATIAGFQSEENVRDFLMNNNRYEFKDKKVVSELWSLFKMYENSLNDSLRYLFGDTVENELIYSKENIEKDLKTKGLKIIC